MGDRGGKGDVTHALTANRRLGDLNATALTDDVLVASTLVLATRALPVLGRTEDALTEQTVLLRLEGAVVDGFRLLDLARRPRLDVF